MNPAGIIYNALSRTLYWLDQFHFVPRQGVPANENPIHHEGN